MKALSGGSCSEYLSIHFSSSRTGSSLKDVLSTERKEKSATRNAGVIQPTDRALLSRFLDQHILRTHPKKNHLAGASPAPHSAAVAACQFWGSAPGQLTLGHTDAAAAACETTCCSFSTHTRGVEQPLGSSDHHPLGEPPHRQCEMHWMQDLLAQERTSEAYLSELPWLRREVLRCWSPHPAAYTGPRCGNRDKNKKCFHYPLMLQYNRSELWEATAGCAD